MEAVPYEISCHQQEKIPGQAKERIDGGKVALRD
jgi:hypothetical protein